MAGYSGTPLPKKLGVDKARSVLVVGAPDDVPIAGNGASPYDVILWFVTERAVLAAGFVEMAARLTPAGGLWICWPKKASKLPTDLYEDILREIGLPHGLVDNKVCAIDDRWSGLRFVWRKENR